jgi:hypothetical protein
MKSSYAFTALVGFALLNTAFLGVYLLSSTSAVGGLNAASYGPSGTMSASSTSSVPADAVTATSTLTTTVQSIASTASTAAGPTTSAGTTASATSGLSQSNSTALNGSAFTTNSNPGSITAGAALGSSPTQSLKSVYQFLVLHSLALAPGSWVLVGGMWIWRGRMRSRWTDFGFDSDVFGLFVKMKGGKTRIRLLDALSLPKDRLQLAQELGLDWKGVDRHLLLMKKYGFVDDKIAYGKVRMYELTPLGVSLLRLLQELSREERRESTAGPQTEQDRNPQA